MRASKRARATGGRRPAASAAAVASASAFTALLLGASLAALLASPAPAGRRLLARAAPGEVGLSSGPAVSVEQVAAQADRGVLKVRNRTPFIVILYIGGIRVGWMRPYRVGTIRGLVPGYHRLYAHSRYGSMAWGPRDVWVPGTWNLIY